MQRGESEQVVLQSSPDVGIPREKDTQKMPLVGLWFFVLCFLRPHVFGCMCFLAVHPCVGCGERWQRRCGDGAPHLRSYTGGRHPG